MEKTLPCDIEAERATLGSVLLNRDALTAVAHWLQPADFYLEKHALIYQAMLACADARVPPDTTTVAAELRRRERLDAVGGLLYLIELANDTPTAQHVEYYAHIVERTAVCRRVIAAGGDIAALGYEEQFDPDALAVVAEQRLAQALKRASDTGMQPLREILGQLYDALNAGERTGVMTGFADLDGMTGGLQRGDLVILAARPSVGKTAFATQVAAHVAQSGAGPVLFYSLEMSAQQLGQRLATLRTGIDMQRLRSGQLREEQLRAFADACGVLSELPLYVDDLPAQDITALTRKALLMAAEVGPPSLIAIDYLQLATAQAENRVQEVSAISRGLKALAKLLHCPVLALAQLSRAVEGRSDHRPMLSDLRESGQLEQDADLVVFLYREELYDKETDKRGIAEAILAKHRNGALGVVPLRFDGPRMAFGNLTYRELEGY